MTKPEIQDLYADLNNLLHDICAFLKDEVDNGRMSKDARKMASALIDRSKQQLQIITEIAPADLSISGKSDYYMDMKNKQETDEYIVPDSKTEEEVLDIYSEANITDTEDLNSTSIQSEDALICPYANIPASQLTDAKKTGIIYRKEKFWFMYTKKTYACIQDTWILLYSSDKDSKPLYTMNLTQYEAQMVDLKTRNDKKMSLCFCLVGKTLTKPVHFIAQTHKDMLQWVAAINRQSQIISTPASSEFGTLPSQKRSLPPIPTLDDKNDDNDNNIYAHLKESNDGDDKDENEDVEYNDIIHQEPESPVTIQPPPRPVAKPVPVPVPPRTPLGKVPSAKVIVKAPSEDSLGNEYDPVMSWTANTSAKNTSTDHSFSEDDSDEVYNEIDTSPYPKISNAVSDKTAANIKSLQPLNNKTDFDDEEEIYNEIQNVALSPEIIARQHEILLDSKIGGSKHATTNKGSFTIPSETSKTILNTDTEQEKHKNNEGDGKIKEITEVDKPKPSIKPKLFSIRQKGKTIEEKFERESSIRVSKQIQSRKSSFMNQFTRKKTIPDPN